jgi:hypothetical protein
MKPMLNVPGTTRLTLTHDVLCFNFTSKYNLRRYTQALDAKLAATSNDSLTAAPTTTTAAAAAAAPGAGAGAVATAGAVSTAPARNQPRGGGGGGGGVGGRGGGGPTRADRATVETGRYCSPSHSLRNQ